MTMTMTVAVAAHGCHDADDLCCMLTLLWATRVGGRSCVWIDDHMRLSLWLTREYVSP